MLAKTAHDQFESDLAVAWVLRKQNGHVSSVS